MFRGLILSSISLNNYTTKAYTFDGPDGKNRVMLTSGLILCAQSFNVSNPLIAACVQIGINIHLIIAIISADGKKCGVSHFQHVSIQEELVQVCLAVQHVILEQALEPFTL